MAILGQAAAEPQPWYTEGWVLWLIAAACILAPSAVAYLISGGLRAKDMWGRMAVVLTALTCGVVIVASQVGVVMVVALEKDVMVGASVRVVVASIMMMFVAANVRVRTMIVMVV